VKVLHRSEGERGVVAVKKKTTLRLNMPRWQGGNRHDYHSGSELPAWLAPVADGPVETVPVPPPRPGESSLAEPELVLTEAQVELHLDRRVLAEGRAGRVRHPNRRHGVDEGHAMQEPHAEQHALRTGDAVRLAAAIVLQRTPSGADLIRKRFAVAISSWLR